MLLVDAADYVVWRKNNNTAITLPNDLTPGTVSQADYDVWRAHFGHPYGSGWGASVNTAVPKPITALRIILGGRLVPPARPERIAILRLIGA